MHVWVDAPLTTRVTLNMKDFGGREVGRSANKSFEVPHVSSITHRLSAKGSRHACENNAQSTRKECIYLCSHSGLIHGLT